MFSRENHQNVLRATTMTFDPYRGYLRDRGMLLHDLTAILANGKIVSVVVNQLTLSVLSTRLCYRIVTVFNKF